MAVPLISRRKLIISSFVAWAGTCLPGSSFSGTPTPDWLAPLLRNLTGFASWVRPECTANGEVVIHCGARDFSAWAMHAGALAGNERKVKAHGNTLTFHLSDKQVRVVIHPDIA